jgi:hypothetical protein
VDLLKFGIMDEIVTEPLGGAHADPVSAFPFIKEALMSVYRRYEHMSAEEIMLDRCAGALGGGAGGWRWGARCELLRGGGGQRAGLCAGPGLLLRGACC